MTDTAQLELLIVAKQQTDAAFAAVLKNLAGVKGGAKDSADASKLLSAASDELNAKLSTMGGNAGMVGSVLSKLGPWGLAAAAGIGAVVAIGYELGSTTMALAEHAHALEAEATQAGISTDALQVYQVAAVKLGMSAETITSGITRLTRSIATGSDDVKIGIAAMGLSFDQIRQMDPAAQFDAMIAGLHGIKDQGEQARLTFQLFGRNMEILRAVRGDFDAAKSAAAEYNLVIGGETIKSSAELKQSMDLLDMSWTHLKYSLVEGLATSGVNKWIDGLSFGLGKLSTAAQGAGAALSALYSQPGQSSESQSQMFAKMSQGEFQQYLAIQKSVSSFFGASAQSGGQDDQQKAATNTKEYREAVLALQKAKLGMLPVLDQEHGATLAAVEATKLEAQSKIAAIYADTKYGDGVRHLNATGEKMVDLTNKEAKARASAIQAAADQKEAIDRLKMSLSDTNAVAAASDALFASPYEAATAAIKRETAAQIAEYEAEHKNNMSDPANQKHVDALREEADLKTLAALKQKQRSDLDAELSAEAALHQSELGLATDYDRQKKALEDEAEKLQVEAERGDDAARAVARLQLQQNANQRATLEATHALEQQQQVLAGVATGLGNMASLLESVGLGSSKAAASLKDFSGVATSLGTFTKTLADPKSNIVDKIGAGIGLAASGIKAVVGLFGGTEAEHVNDMRDAYTQQAGGIQHLAEAAREAGTDLSAFYSASTEADWLKASEALDKSLKDGADALVKQKSDAITAAGGWDVFAEKAANAGIGVDALNNMMRESNPENVTKILDYINNGIDAQAAAYKTADDAASKYGLTTAELGPKWAQSKLNDQSADLLKDWSALTARGADVVAVDEHMTQSVQDYLTQALQTGAAVPEAMKPMLQSMVDQGDLTDAAGNKLKDLSGITFAADMTAEFKTLIESIQDMVNAIRGIAPAAQQAASAVGSINLPAQGQWIPADNAASQSMAGVDYAKVAQLAGGGRITQSGLVGVHAGEVVGTPDQVAGLGGGGSSRMEGLLGQLVELQRQALAQGAPMVQLDGQAVRPIIAGHLASQIRSGQNPGGLTSAIQQVVGNG